MIPPAVRQGVDLSRFLTIRAGGRAELFAAPADEQELVALLGWARAQGLKVWVLGSGSNVLVADAGLPGLVLKLGKPFATVRIAGCEVEAGAAVRLPALAALAARAGLAGLEFGISIPGSLGGAVRMNAGAYGGELAKVLVEARIASAEGVTQLAGGQLAFGYRRSRLHPGEQVVTAARLRLSPGAPTAIRKRLAALRASRRLAQPAGIKTFGSTFKNPEGARSAGELLDAAGCTGLTVGRARFSPKHANFIENMGGATTAEILALMAEGRRRVKERFGVELEPEVVLLGETCFPWEEGG